MTSELTKDDQIQSIYIYNWCQESGGHIQRIQWGLEWRSKWGSNDDVGRGYGIIVVSISDSGRPGSNPE